MIVKNCSVGLVWGKVKIWVMLEVYIKRCIKYDWLFF